MKEEIEKVLAELDELKCLTRKEVEDARVRFLGKKGEVTALFEQFRTVGPEMKREYGRKLNELKQTVTAKIEEFRASVSDNAESDGPKEDLTMPGDAFEPGSRHPVSIVRQQIVEIFRKFGYDNRSENFRRRNRKPYLYRALERKRRSRLYF